MFITGMNKTKTYVEPEMKVIEVDMESLVAGSPTDEDDEEDDNYGADGSDYGSGDGQEDFVKAFRGIWF